MKYVKISANDNSSEKSEIYLELDVALYEIRKVEQFKDRCLGYAELAIPDHTEIDPMVGCNQFLTERGGTVHGDQSWEGTWDPDNAYWTHYYSAEMIRKDQFELIWRQAVASHN